MQNGRLSAVRPAESASTDTAAPAAGVFPDRLFIAHFTPGYRLPADFHPV